MLRIDEYRKFLSNKFGGTDTKSQLMKVFTPSNYIKKLIALFEGSSMKTNRSFEAEAKDFWNAIPLNIRNRLSQKSLDGLFSYSYNVGAGNFKRRVVPLLVKYFNGLATALDVEKSMYALKDTDQTFGKGLTRRRNFERAEFHSGLNDKSKPFSSRYDYDYHTKQQLVPVLFNDVMKGIEELPITLSNIDYTINNQLEYTPNFYFADNYSLPIDIQQQSVVVKPLKDIIEELLDLLFLPQYVNTLSYIANNNYTEQLQNQLSEKQEEYNIYQKILNDTLFDEYNITALGGNLFDNITGTFNPNNRIGLFSGFNKIPQVRY